MCLDNRAKARRPHRFPNVELKIIPGSIGLDFSAFQETEGRVRMENDETAKAAADL